VSWASSFLSVLVIFGISCILKIFNLLCTIRRHAVAWGSKILPRVGDVIVSALNFIYIKLKSMIFRLWKFFLGKGKVVDGDIMTVKSIVSCTSRMNMLTYIIPCGCVFFAILIIYFSPFELFVKIFVFFFLALFTYFYCKFE
jgi:hypothetical protein